MGITTRKHTRRLVFSAFAVLLTVLLTLPLYAAYPQPTDYISDESGVLSTTTKDALIEAISSHNQIA